MIQVCSGCGTRWNVRDRQRVWCPRCQGTLLAPSGPEPGAGPPWDQRGSAQSAAWRQAPPPLPAGYSWIAVRPGPPPPARPPRRLRGPTPRYAAIPQWSLGNRINSAAAPQSTTEGGPSAARVRARLFAGLVVLAIAALVHFVRYVLLVVNRNTLLNPVVAQIALWLGVVASLAAIAAMFAVAVVLIQWLIARRAAVFAHCGSPEPRSAQALWAGCLVPLVDLVWVPVYVIELALIEGAFARLRRPILVWWALWVSSTAVSIVALATSRAENAQGIGNNTLAMTLAYVVAAVALAGAGRVFEGFERKPVERRPAHRWVVVPDDPGSGPDSSAAVELEGEKPAA